MSEHLQESRDIIRQRELLEAIHTSHYRQLRAAGTLGRILHTEVGYMLMDPLSYARPYRNALDMASVEIGIAGRANRRRVVDIGCVTTNNELIVFQGFIPHDVELVDSMLEGLLQDHDIGFLPNLNEYCNAICG